MQIGQSFVFTVNTDPAGVAVTWTSSNTDVATVTGAGVVTAHDIGYATITASSGEQSDSRTVEVVPVGDYEYYMTVSHYYDNGYNNNYSSIQDANNNAAKRLARIFRLRLYSDYYSYTSVADTCSDKKHTPSGCPVNPPCYTPKALREQLVFDKGNGTDIHPKVLWSSHTAAESDSSDSDSISKTIVILPMNFSNDYQFIHELSHQIGAKDHYCIIKEGVCVNEYCVDHGIYDSVSATCIMIDKNQLESATDQAFFCNACKSLINAHLSGHHLIGQH